MRQRVTFSIEGSLLKRLDQLVDGIQIRNRSHALEVVLEKLLGADVFILVNSKKELQDAKERAQWAKDQGFNPVFVAPAGVMAGECIVDPGKGTAAAIRILQPRTKHVFVVIYSDAPKIDVHDMLRFHHRQGGIATLAVTSTTDPKNFGVVKMRGVNVTEFVEKPKKAESYLVSAGIFIFDPEIFKYIAPDANSLEHNVLNNLAQNGLLNGYLFEGLLNV